MTEDAAPDRAKAKQRRIDHPLVPALLGLFAALTVVALYVPEGGDLSHLVRASPPWADAAAVPPGLAVVSDVNEGYDGMFYYRLALDPFTDRATDRGITFDRPAYRQQRIVYPLLAWALALGDEGRVAAALAFVNVLGVFGLGWLGGALAKSAGRHALWGTLFVAYPGVVTTLRSDLTEIVGAAFVLAGLLLLRSARTAAAVGVLTVGGLARETTLLVSAVTGLARIRQAPRRPRQWLPFAAPVLVAIVWQAALAARWGPLPAAQAGEAFDPPLMGLLAAAWLNAERLSPLEGAIWLAVIAFVLGSVAVGARALGSQGPLTHERWIWLAYLALPIVLEANIWANDAVLRTLTELGMLTALLVLSAPRALRWTLLAMELSLSLVLVAVGGHL